MKKNKDLAEFETKLRLLCALGVKMETDCSNCIFNNPKFESLGQSMRPSWPANGCFDSWEYVGKYSDIIGTPSPRRHSSSFCAIALLPHTQKSVRIIQAMRKQQTNK
jgi:hypothetical protein